MVIIDDTSKSIQLTRGDYASLIFIAEEFNPDTEEYEMYQLQEGDKVMFQLAKSYGKPLLTITKTKEDDEETTADDYTIEIEPEFTKTLKFGEYFYDVALVVNGDEVCTYIGSDGKNKPKFTILEEAGGGNE